jgi:hypothetical protein
MAIDTSVTSVTENGVASVVSEDASKLENGTKSEEKKEDETPKAPKGSKCEIKSLAQKGDGEVQEKDLYLTSLKKPFNEYALVAKQVFNEKDKLEKTVIDIYSPHVLACLKDVVKYYPAEPLHFDEGVSFDSPFKLLNHHVQEVTKWVENTSDEEAKKHTQLLLDFLDNEAGDKGLESKRLSSKTKCHMSIRLTNKPSNRGWSDYLRLTLGNLQARRASLHQRIRPRASLPSYEDWLPGLTMLVWNVL